MRAFMSSTSDRVRESLVPSILAARASIGLGALTSDHAVAEARRILDQNEPAGAGAHYTPADGYRYMSDVWTATPVDGNAHAAAIESLAAFVGDAR